MRRFLSILLLAAMVLSFTACGSDSASLNQQAAIYENLEYMNKDESRTKGSQISTEQLAEVYGKERIEIPGNQSVIYGGELNGGKIFAYGIDSYDNTVFYLIDPLDCSVEILPIPFAERVYFLGQSEENLQPVLTIDENGEYVLSLFADAQLVQQLTLALPEPYSEDVIVGLTVLPDHLVVELSREIIALDKNGEFEKSLGSFSSAALCSISPEGRLVIAGEMKKDIPSAEPMTKVNLFGSDLELLGEYQSEIKFDALCAGSAEGELLAMKNGIVYSYRYESGEISAVIDAVSSGMNYDRIFYAPDGKYITIQGGVPTLWSAIKDENLTTLTLAAYHLSYPMEMLVNMFNESSSDCKIKVVDYAAYEDSGSENGLMLLNADIVAGFTPDLYDLTSLNVQSFVRNGLLEDMQSFLASRGIQASDYVSSVFEQLETEDGLFYMMPSFTLISVIGSRDMLGGDAHLTIEKFFSAAAELSPEALFGPELTREEFLRYTLLFNADEYLNENSKTCQFVSSSFGRFIEFAASLPEEVDYSQIDSQDISRAYAGEQQLVFSSVSGDLVSVFSYYDTAFAGKGEYVGFPSDLSSGTAIVPSCLIGVSSDSLRKEQAMDFIAFILSDYCQTSQAVFGLPIVQNALEKRMDYWVSEYEKYDKSLITVYDGSRVEIGRSASADYARERVCAAIAAADTLTVFDEALFQLVYAECQSYFSGRTSLSQCLETLQSKVRIYLAEQQ